jgi:hypothetical protein
MQALVAIDAGTGIWLSPIIVALIGGPLMFLVRMLDRHNTRQHGQNMDVLTSIKASVEEVKNDVKQIDTRLERHIDWHMHQTAKEKV